MNPDTRVLLETISLLLRESSPLVEVGAEFEILKF
jgi:hypothetical protein